VRTKPLYILQRRYDDRWLYYASSNQRGEYRLTLELAKAKTYTTKRGAISAAVGLDFRVVEHPTQRMPLAAQDAAKLAAWEGV
jgi:hypothetical protein